MYDVNVLKNPNDCLTVLARAKDQENEEFYSLVFKRYCELIGQAEEDPNDPMVRAFHEMVAAYEVCLTEKNGKKTAASRLRQMMKRKAIPHILSEWATRRDETPGFDLLISKGMPEYTGEYIVVQYKDRFPPDVVKSAQARLAMHQVNFDKS